MALLSVSNLVFRFGDEPLLDGVNLTLDAGEHVGLVGRNGCGKSTLLKLIAGVAEGAPDSGQIQLARGAASGYLHQDPKLDSQRTLLEEATTALGQLAKLQARMDDLTQRMAEAESEAL